MIPVRKLGDDEQYRGWYLYLIDGELVDYGHRAPWDAESYLPGEPERGTDRWKAWEASQ